MNFIKTYVRKCKRQLYGGFKGTPAVSQSFRTRLNDGTGVIIRPMMPADAAGLAAMHDRLSNTSIYYRYLMIFRPTQTDFEAVCSMSDTEGGGMVAEVAGEEGALAGMAYYRITESRPNLIAEPAILVEDRFQNRGMGRFLLAQLLQMAETQGISVLESTLHPQNDRMRSLLYSAGRPIAETPDTDSLVIRQLIRPDEESDFAASYCEDMNSRCGFRFGLGWI